MIAAKWVAAMAIAVLGAAGGALVFRGTLAQADAQDAARVEVSPADLVRVAPRSAVPSLSWGPSAIDLAAATVEASHLPLDVAAGQVIVAAISSPDPVAAGALVAEHHLAGVIIMAPAVTDAAGVQALTAAVSAAAATDGRDWPAVVSVDQEGGPVARLAPVLPDLPAFMAAGAASDKALVTQTYAAAAADLAALGFTVDWAPVADVTIGAADPVIGFRSAGQDPANVSATVVAAVDGFVQGGILPAIKHFPGHGSVTTDSHAALPVQGSPVSALATADLVPFQAAIDAGAPMVMMGHIAVPEWGGGAATVSPAAYAYLRDDMGFDGVAVTDALNMGALDQSVPGQVAVQALAAGADLLLLPADPIAAKAAIVEAVELGQLSRHRLDEAIARVSLLMEWQADLPTAAGPSDPSYARAFAASAAVVSGPTCAGRLVGDTVTIVGGWPNEQAALAEALAVHGIGQGGGTKIRLLGTTATTASSDIVVSMEAPWSLTQARAGTYIGLFGRSNDVLAGLADVLAGAAEGNGTWPVAGMPAACG